MSALLKIADHGVDMGGSEVAELVPADSRDDRVLNGPSVLVGGRLSHRAREDVLDPPAQVFRYRGRAVGGRLSSRHAVPRSPQSIDYFVSCAPVDDVTEAAPVGAFPERQASFPPAVGSLADRAFAVRTPTRHF